MKKISTLIILVSIAALVGFSFDYFVNVTKLKNYQRGAEILKNKYDNEEPSIDYTEVKRQRDSLYFLLNQEKITKFRREIHGKMRQVGYDLTYDEFIERTSSDGDDELWVILYRNRIYVDDLWKFERDFYGILPTK